MLTKQRAMLDFVKLLFLVVMFLSPAPGDSQLLSRKWIPSYAGPYTVVMSRAFMCPDRDSNDPGFVGVMRVSHWNPQKPAELQRVYGNWSWGQDITDDDWAYFVLDKRSNNQWKPNAFVFNFPKGACSIFRKLFPDSTTMVFGERTEPCVLAKGFYTFDRKVDWSSPEVPVLPYGEYRLTNRMGRTVSRRSIFCYMFEMSIIPRA